MNKRAEMARETWAGLLRVAELVLGNPILMSIGGVALVQYLENQRFNVKTGSRRVWVDEVGHWQPGPGDSPSLPSPSYAPGGGTTAVVLPPLIPGVTPPAFIAVTPSGALDLTVNVPAGAVRSPTIPGTIIPNPVSIMLNEADNPSAGTSTIIAGGPDVGYIIFPNETEAIITSKTASNTTGGSLWTPEQLAAAMVAISEDPWLNGLFGGPEG